MFKKSIIALSALSMVAVPAAADAHRYRGYDNGYYNQNYNNGYDNQNYNNGYNNGYYNNGYQNQAYDNGYYGRSNGYRDHRCSGTTGTIVGGVGGALIGRSIGRGSYHQNSGTTGTILGAAIGALVGRQVGKSTC